MLNVHDKIVEHMIRFDANLCAGMLARMAQGALVRAWDCWLDYVAERAQLREQLQVAVQHWTARELAAAFCQFRYSLLHSKPWPCDRTVTSLFPSCSGGCRLWQPFAELALEHSLVLILQLILYQMVMVPNGRMLLARCSGTTSWVPAGSGLLAASKACPSCSTFSR